MSRLDVLLALLLSPLGVLGLILLTAAAVVTDYLERHHP
jgi:Tfp pilus assembly protein PilV